MKNILVTGGAGYIGSHTCKMLSQAGYLPITYDNLVYGHRWAVKWGPLEKGNLSDKARLEEVFCKYRPQAVLHFAAYAYVGESVKNPAKYYRNNIEGSLSLLDTMLQQNVDKIVFSSSCATYGVPKFIPINEEHPQLPVNPYGYSKLVVERMLRDFFHAYELRSISLRYFNAAGADSQGEVGELHEPETHLIPLVLETALGHRPSITIYGDDYDTQDGTCIRDYIHVTDLAEAHILALQALEEETQCSVYNLGNGNGFSVKQVIDVAKQVTGREIPISVGSRRSGDPAQLVGDASKIAQILGWQPRYPSLSAIIETAWQWQSKGLSNVCTVGRRIIN